MKYICCILLIAVLLVCGMSTAGVPAKRVYRGVGKCFITLCASPKNGIAASEISGEPIAEENIPVISLSLAERTGKLLTW